MHQVWVPPEKMAKNSHQQVLARVVAAQDHVVHLADVHEFFAARVADGALDVLLHLGQRVGQLALDRFEDAFALHAGTRPC